MSRRSFPLLTILAMLAALIAAVPVSASSRGCLKLGPGCGASVDPATGLGWKPKGGAASPGNPVNAYPVAGGGTGTDWLRSQPMARSYYRYQYAPGGTGSGLCASDPGPPHGIVLRPCNRRNWQEFTPGPGGTLVDVATGLPVRDNGQGTQLTGTAGAATRWYWHGGGGRMPAPPGFATKIFEDQFTGRSLDASKWVTYVGDRGIRWNDRGLLPAPYSGFNQPGATNGAIYSPAQVTVGNGLAITAQRNTGPYSGTYPWLSGTVSTEGKFTLPTTSAWFVQAKIRMPDTSQGLWPAMWFLCAVACSPENELDGWEGGFHELPGVPANRTAHYDYFSTAGQRASEQNIGTNVSQGYHVYGVRFIPGQSITWFLDGVQRFKVTAGGGVGIPALPYELMLNVAVASPVASGYHTLPGSGTSKGVMRVAEVQAWKP